MLAITYIIGITYNYSIVKNKLTKIKLIVVLDVSTKINHYVFDDIYACTLFKFYLKFTVFKSVNYFYVFSNFFTRLNVETRLIKG